MSAGITPKPEKPAGLAALEHKAEQMDDVPVRGDITHWRPLPDPPQHGGVDG